ncbi:hypothetical protein D3C81_1184230 [compost metagenome]
MFGVFPRCCVAHLDGFVTATQDDLHGADFTGVVLLERTRETQADAGGVDGTELAQGNQVQSAGLPFELDAVVGEAQVNLDRAVHAAAAIGFHLATERGQGDRRHHADVAVGVVEQVEVFQFARQGHGGVLRYTGQLLILLAKLIR